MTEKNQRFVDSLLENAEACRVAVRLVHEGVSLPRTFGWLEVYVLGHSIAGERRKRGKEAQKIINRGVRSYGVSPEVGRWLRDRAELAHSMNGLGRVHNTDALAAAHMYLELRTKRKVSMSEMAFLVDAANSALGRKVDGGVTEPKNLQHELARWRKNNPRFVGILMTDIKSKL
jgi:hypothetical protein